MPVRKSGFVIFADSIGEGPQPALRDGHAQPWVFPSRVSAQREIADNLITRLQEFIDGEREFDEVESDEYVVEVVLDADGSIVLPEIPAVKRL
jgi:hypothetical protein